jgi:hypothetical protein
MTGEALRQNNVMKSYSSSGAKQGRHALPLRPDDLQLSGASVPGGLADNPLVKRFMIG